jgi:hypothetical protein
MVRTAKLAPLASAELFVSLHFALRWPLRCRFGAFVSCCDGYRLDQVRTPSVFFSSVRSFGETELNPHFRYSLDVNALCIHGRDVV